MKIQTKLGLGFGIQVLLTAVLGLSVLIGMAKVQSEFSHNVEVNAPVLTNARHLMKLVIDMETGQRGFLITQNDEFLEPYITGSKEFHELIKTEKRLVSDKPSQVKTLDHIESLVHQWLDNVANPEIAMARKIAAKNIDNQRFQEILNRGMGKQFMDRILALGHVIEISFFERSDWEGAFALEAIERCIAGREDAQRGFLITGKEEFLEQSFAKEQINLTSLFTRLRAIVLKRGRTEELSEKINQLEQLTHQWEREAAEPEIAARRSMIQHTESFKAVSALLEAGTGKALIDEIRRKFAQFIETEESDAALSYAATTGMTTSTRNVTIALLALATCVGVVVAAATARTVTHPLAKLAQGVEAIGHGDLKTQIQCDSTGEIGSLIHAFNAMATDLCVGQDKLEALATTDHLTGLPNREVFCDRLRQRSKQSRRDNSHFAVLFFDFDRFKVVNDSLGHEVGDALLCDIAKIFTNELRESDTVARFGGDEFVVLLDNLTHQSHAEHKAKKLLEIFAKPHQLDGHWVFSTASIGLVTNEFAYENPDDMIRDADTAMYQAKDNGKARVVVFDREMHAKALDRLKLEGDMRQALANQEFHLVYQPIVNLNTGELDGFESLLRWKHPEHGIISPLDFIPIAEETGLIVDIGRWTLDQSAQQITDWNRRLNLGRMLKINVNISKRQLLNPAFVDEILECQRHYDLQPNEVHLEITETIIADNRTNVIPLLKKLRDHGFPIAMDDFGTGVSSLSALHNYPIDVLKIDQSFMSGLNSNRSLLAVVASITNLTENLGIPTVAEGIESADILGVLQSIGCKWGQGYYFAKPLLAAEAEAYILAHPDYKGELALAASETFENN